MRDLKVDGLASAAVKGAHATAIARIRVVRAKHAAVGMRQRCRKVHTGGIRVAVIVVTPRVGVNVVKATHILTLAITIVCLDGRNGKIAFC